MWQSTHETTLEYRDLNEITTKAVREFQISGESVDTIENTQCHINGNQQLPAVWENKLLEAGIVKIERVPCRSGEKISPAMCLKCLEYRHIARSSTSRRDRSNRLEENKMQRVFI